jgi:imidazolonepropionase-like amidohydrolase
MNKGFSTIITMFSLLLIPFSTLASNQLPAPDQAGPIALAGGTIHTISRGNIENGTILFDKGKITGIGQTIDLPKNTSIINITGKHVYPGLISANSDIGLTEISAVRATNDNYEVGAIKPNVRAEVAFNPDSEVIPVTRANGILLSLSVPGGGLISGTSALMLMDGWTWETMTLKSPVGLHIHWPDMNINYSPDAKKGPDDQKKDIDKEIEKISDAFLQARSYLKARHTEKEKGIPYHKTDMRWESMASVLDGKVPVYIHAEDLRQIQAAVDWAGEMGVKMVLVGGYDSWRVSKLLAEKKVPVIIAGIHRLPARAWEPFDTPFTLPEKLLISGVKFCIATDGSEPHNDRNLPYQAATAVAYGLPEEEALKAITLYPAEIMGIADRAGSLETGKDATLFISSGNPLSENNQVEAAFIQGRKIDLSSRHTELYDKYKEKYRQLKLTPKSSL